MYAGIAAFTKLFGRGTTPLRVVDRDGLHGYVFATVDRPADPTGSHQPTVAVVWLSNPARRLTLDPDCKAVDLVGNPIGERTIELTETPVYLESRDSHSVLRTLDEGE